MNDFLLYSIIGSVILTVALNVLPQLFPNAARRAEEAMRDALSNSQENRRVRVFFPWKTMLVVSIGLTILVNAIGWFAGN